MKTAQRRPFRYCLNALLLVAPAWFFYASLTPPPLPDPWDTQALGPWSLTPIPADDAPPYRHDGSLVKDFHFRICDGCGARMRTAIARVAMAAPELDASIEGIVHGHGDFLEAHVPWPEELTESHRLWVTSQDWSGATYHASWPLSLRED
jgi:hypothetical protein